MQFPKPTRILQRQALPVACTCVIGLTAWLPVSRAGELDTTPSAADATADPLVGPEQLRRQGLWDEAQELMANGREALAQDRPDEAMLAFGGVREMLPQAPATAELRDEATALYAQAAIAQAGKLAERGDLDGARGLVDSVLAENVAPGHPGALEMKARLNDPVRTNPALTTAHVDRVAEVVKTLELAQGAADLGQYDRAQNLYEQVLRLDPTNVTARRGMERLAGPKADRSAFDHARAEMLAEVDQQWELQPPPSDDLALGPVTDPQLGPAAGMTVAQKLKSIRIPRVAFDQVTLVDAVEFLRAASMREDHYELDPAAKGVNISVNLSGIDDEAQQAILNTRFDLQLRDVPVEQVVKYITEFCKTSYQVDDFSLIIRPPGVALDELISRSYQVPPDFVSALSAGLSQPAEADPFGDNNAAPSGGLLVARQSVQELLKSKGVSFPDGAIASFNPGTATLRVINTPLNHDTISTIIDTIRDREPVAVSVQVTVLKIQQENLKELGFDWLLNPTKLGGQGELGGGTIGSSGGRFGEDFSPTIGSLPSQAGAAMESGVLTNGLRSGSQMFSGNSLDEMILNPDRGTQTARVAPGLLALNGIFTDGAAQMMIRGLDQKKGADMMANPSVVTTSGQAAKIVVAKEFIYPTEYDPPELGSGGSSRVVIPANPTAFETRNVGITLDVLPVADDSKTYIDLTLSPEIIEFDGFVNYGSPIYSVGVGSAGLFGFTEESVLLTENRIMMPIFSTQRTTTQLTVADGATIVYGGLLSSSIQSVEDKVPVLGSVPMLGRLFQSQGLRPVQTAVVFMVRVQLMDPTGRPYRQLSSR